LAGRQREGEDRVPVSETRSPQAGRKFGFRPKLRASAELKAAVALIAPAAVALACVTVYPTLYTIWLSFRNTDFAGQQNSFTGLQNFVRVFSDGAFWNAWVQTGYFTVVSTFFETLIGLGMALILHETFRGRGFVRAAMLIPWAIPTVVTSRMFGWMFDGQNGIVNYVLESLGLISKYVNWTGSQAHAMQTIIVADVWKTAPFMALILLAGLQTIPEDVSEAGRVDGAGPFRIFWSIRLPLLMPTLLVAGLLRALDAFRIFDLVWVLTGGGPANSTETLSTLTFKTSFSALEFGYGSSIVVAMFVTEILIAAAFGIFILRAMERTEQ
jgi:ABC-type sugar transport system permease subunit